MTRKRRPKTKDRRPLESNDPLENEDLENETPQGNEDLENEEPQKTKFYISLRRWHSASFGHVLWKQSNKCYESRPQENEDVRAKNPVKTVGEIRTQLRDMNLQCWRDFLSNNNP